MALRIPPVVVFLVFGALMWLVARFLPFGEFKFFGRIWLAGFLLLAALVVAGTALIQFFASGTSIDPHHPEKASKLVTSGVYQISRNPMYLSLLMILLALGLWLGNAFNTLTAAGFVYYMNAFQIKSEEEQLLKIFGSNYKQYCSMVRRWF
jgi:protein-S-isoprenylcysteine O-methyltransferase Ste14